MTHEGVLLQPQLFELRRQQQHKGEFSLCNPDPYPNPNPNANNNTKESFRYVTLTLTLTLP